MDAVKSPVETARTVVPIEKPKPSTQGAMFPAWAWIAAAALKALPAAQLAELRDREFLEWIYFQMASIAHVSALVARKNRRLSGVTAARA